MANFKIESNIGFFLTSWIFTLKNESECDYLIFHFRMPENSPDTGKARSRPLYDVPYMFEAREFLRKKLIGKKVNVVVDYKQPANLSFPEKTCCTVTIGGM